MALNKTRLRDQIVFLEAMDACQSEMNPLGYLAAARAVRRTIERDLADLPMRAFVYDELPTLQTTAQNVFFDRHRRFADLDGQDGARRAQTESNSLLRRLTLRPQR